MNQLLFLYESSKMCKKYKSYLDSQIKYYGQIAFTLTYLSAEIRVNEMQLTDTTLVHKHEQQTMKIKYKSKGRENANTR